MSHFPYIWITPRRVFYAGRLNTPRMRIFGAVTVYMPADGLIEISTADREWERAPLAVVPPYLPHVVVSDSPDVFIVLLEADAFDLSRLPDPLLRTGGTSALWFADRIRKFGAELQSRIDSRRQLTSMDYDHLLFDEALPERTLDRRLEPVVRAFQLDPLYRAAGEECATAANLSYSHFLFLFKREVGVPFAKFRAWKRARAVFDRLQAEANIATLAQDLGYADSSQFYHSMRDVYGLIPKQMFNAKGLLVYRPTY